MSKDLPLISQIILDEAQRSRSHGQSRRRRTNGRNILNPPHIYTIAEVQGQVPRYLLVYEVKNPITGIPSWGYPGGARKGGEEWRETATRELKEEAGVTERVQRRHFVTSFHVRGFGETAEVLFVGYHIYVPPSTIPKPGPEQLDAAFFTDEEIDELIFKHKVFQNHIHLRQIFRSLRAA